MREATIQLLLEVEVIERVGEVRPVQVRVDAEHLSEDDLTNLEELVGEARSLAEPLGFRSGAGELREGVGVEGGILRVGDATCFRGENVDVVNLARDPTLHECHVLVSRELDRLAVAVEPGE